MKKTLSLFFAALISLAALSGCLSFKKVTPPSESASEPPESQNPALSDAPKPEPSSPESKLPEDSSPDAEPDAAAEKLLKNITDFDENGIKAFAQEYFPTQVIPDEYYAVLKPIMSRVTYKIGNSRVDGDTAEVDVAITAIDSQAAFNNVIPGALMHLAVMQMTGKDVSNPEKILIDYATKNIDWDNIPSIKTNTTLHLKKGADGEWKADAANPENLKFANAVSGGAIDAAQSLKGLADRYR